MRTNPRLWAMASRFGLFVMLLACGVSPTGAREQQCPGTQADIAELAGTERASVCEAVQTAETILRNCGIGPKRRYIVRLVPEVRNVYGNCIFGQFRSGQDVIAIVEPGAIAALVAAIPDGEPMGIYKRLPPADLHRSLIVHEVSHAIAHQNLTIAPCLAVHEYIASVAQISALSVQSREIYLAAFAGEDIFSTEMFNDLVLSMNPARYTAAAYRHFQRPEHGCAFVRRLLTEPTLLPRIP